MSRKCREKSTTNRAMRGGGGGGGGGTLQHRVRAGVSVRGVDGKPKNLASRQMIGSNVAR